MFFFWSRFKLNFKIFFVFVLFNVMVILVHSKTILTPIVVKTVMPYNKISDCGITTTKANNQVQQIFNIGNIPDFSKLQLWL